MSGALAEQLVLLPDYLGQHLLLSLGALAAGIGLSLPLAIAVTRIRPLQAPVLMVASAIQTVPSLALLALMVPLLGRIGFVPALLALILYSVLPVIRNTVTGIQEVDANLIEAGRGMGMTPGQLLRKVQLPLALPVIIAGIRTATVWVVGMATLSTPVGATSLGNYIFSGLQTQNYVAVLVGCVAAAALALLLDGLIRLLEIGARRRQRGLLALAGLLLVGVLAAGLGPLLAGPRPDARASVVIGGKTFTEQYLLVELLERRLSAVGFAPRKVESLGSTVAFDALLAGRIDAYVDYSGTIWANYMGRDTNPGRSAVLREVRGWLAAKHGIRDVIPLGFENAYALAMSRTAARERGIRTIGELAAQSADLTLAGDYEFFARPEWTALQASYGLEFRELVSMDSTLMYAAAANGDADVITAFSTDGRIAAFDLVTLADPVEAIPPYDALLLIGPGVADARPGLLSALEPLHDRLSGELMRAANRRVDLDGESVAEAARWLDVQLQQAR